MRAYSLGIILLLSLCSSTFSDIFVVKSPPEPWKSALMARYIMHNCDWLSIATISSLKTVKSYPFVSLKSLSDGPKTNSTGVPYIYLSDREMAGGDTEIDNRVTIMTTLAGSGYCMEDNIDPQDPRCAKVIITGRLIKIDKSSPEYMFAQNSLFERHPSMKSWPANHDFYVSKVTIQQIILMDDYRGLMRVSIEDYFNTYMSFIINNDVAFDKVSVLDIRT